MIKIRGNYCSSCFFGSPKSPFTWVKACPLRSVTKTFSRSQPAHCNRSSSSCQALQGDLRAQALLVGKASKENVYIILNIIKTLIWIELAWLKIRYHASELRLLQIWSYWFGRFSKMERILSGKTPCKGKDNFVHEMFSVLYTWRT